VPSEPQPVVRPRFVVGVAVFAAYVLVVVLSKGSDSWLPFLSLLALGFLLGAVVADWWVVAAGVVAAWVLGGPWPTGAESDFAASLLPGSIAFGVLGERLRRSDTDTGMAGTLVVVGSVLLLVGLFALLVAFGGYNDDAPVSPIVGLGFIVMALALPLGLGLFCAGILGMFRR